MKVSRCSLMMNEELVSDLRVAIMDGRLAYWSSLMPFPLGLDVDVGQGGAWVEGTGKCSYFVHGE